MNGKDLDRKWAKQCERASTAVVDAEYMARMESRAHLAIDMVRDVSSKRHLPEAMQTALLDRTLECMNQHIHYYEQEKQREKRTAKLQKKKNGNPEYKPANLKSTKVDSKPKTEKPKEKPKEKIKQTEAKAVPSKEDVEKDKDKYPLTFNTLEEAIKNRGDDD